MGVSLRVGLLRASLRLVLRCSPHWLTPPSASLTRFAIQTFFRNTFLAAATPCLIYNKHQ
ncbi:MAG: hypothetical protein JNM36_08865 [Chitinophagales bacterium]|nr:hypothetical protein [Chitinophagales bacterium]